MENVVAIFIYVLLVWAFLDDHRERETFLGVMLTLVWNLLRLAFKIVSIPFALLLGYRISWGRNKPTRKAMPWNDELMSRKDYQTITRTEYDGISLNGGDRRIDMDTTMRHVLLIGKPGQGKSVSVYYGTLLRMQAMPRSGKPGPSLVISDPSGELWATSGWLAATGYEIRKLSIESRDLSDTATYNPLDYCQTQDDVMALCTIVIEAHGKGSGGDPFWELAAKKVLYVLVLVVLKLPKENRHLAQVYRLVLQFGEGGEGWTNLFAKYADDDMLLLLESFLKKPPKLKQSVIEQLSTCLAAFNSDFVARLTATNTLKLADLRDKPVAVFLVFPKPLVKSFSFLLTIFTTQLMDSMCRELPRPGQRKVIALLDEFANLGRIASIDHLSYIRKFGFGMVAAIQSRSQLGNIYNSTKDEAKMVEDLFSTTIWFPGQPIDVARELSAKVGKTTVEYSTSSESEGKSGENKSSSKSSSTHLMGQELLSPAEIRTMKELLIFIKNERALALPIEPYFNQPELMERHNFSAPQLHYPKPEVTAYFDLDSLVVKRPKRKIPVELFAVSEN